MEDQALQLVKTNLPKEWVIHDYKPDYGINIIVEVAVSLVLLFNNTY